MRQRMEEALDEGRAIGVLPPKEEQCSMDYSREAAACDESWQVKYAQLQQMEGELEGEQDTSMVPSNLASCTADRPAEPEPYNVEQQVTCSEMQQQLEEALDREWAMDVLPPQSTEFDQDSPTELKPYQAG